MWRYPLFAFSFLWRVPLKSYPSYEREFSLALPFFPLVGAIEGSVLSILGILFSPFLLPEYLTLLMLLSIFYLRGIFHLDGLSDTFDALAYKGTGDIPKDREKRLQIMKDSTIGVAGALTVVFNFLSKYLCIKELLIIKPHFLFLPFFLSRAFLLWIIYFSPSAKREGLGFFMKQSLTKKGLILGTLISVIILFCFILLNPGLSLPFLLLIILLNLLVLFLFKKKFEASFGGLTGDNYGALVEISELITLFSLVLLWQKL